MHKSPHLSCLAVACLSLATANAQTTTTQTTTGQPSGWLSTSTSVSRIGKTPNLSWQITVPSIVQNYVEILPPGLVKPKQKLKMDIRVLGAGVTVSSSRGGLPSFVRTEGYFSYDGASYSEIFDGTNAAVTPSSIVYTRTVDAGKTLRFGGRYYYDRNWSTFYSSNNGTNNIRTLVSGQTPPTTFPIQSAPTLEDFIRPYLDSSGKIKIGPMDVIVMMELTHTDAQSTQLGYDLQDLVLLVTFTPI